MSNLPKESNPALGFNAIVKIGRGGNTLIQSSGCNPGGNSIAPAM